MPNSFFHFRKFSLQQDKCAMKVGTDGVLLGAWVNAKNAERILDVGTGSGLIALMLAQKSNARIDSVEIDLAAANQARENYNQSDWGDRLSVYNIAFQNYSPTVKYDLIISNPPFFDKGVKSNQKERAMARHTTTLSIKELIFGAEKILNESGEIALILPVEQRNVLISNIAKVGLWVKEELRIIPIPEKPVRRIIFIIGREVSDNRKLNELVLEDTGRHGYSKKFKEITKEYYVLWDDQFKDE